MGARTECLGELFTYHKLERRVLGLPDAGPAPIGGLTHVSVNFAWPSRRSVRLASFETLGGTARRLCRATVALGIIPDYGGALLERSKAYLYFLGSHWDGLTPDQRRQYSSWAASDSERCNDMDPRSNHVGMIHLQNIAYESCAYSDQAGLRYIVRRTTEILDPSWSGEPLTRHERGFAFNLRARRIISWGKQARPKEIMANPYLSTQKSVAGT